ncbi:class I SAM-dependent methyltransferase [Adhaeribacter radiodurans]|uniref:SAM-dependent methyltransferase n=1 Tax=Adhaeribacter radiodurans TaxID=2745197 RepID=A0A7L7L8I6_9BACT|nr:SAM-dependent methyltransferase [Adhaeribacter radiodurans]QMU29131.1 SAM-dependent methyltransferase [Adhaeribacter radiodurans]
MTLKEIIIQKIQQEGPISFRDYMEMALYYPELGYYTSAQHKIGTQGDFYTSSSLGSAFGTMVGRQLEDMWEQLGKEAFTIVEYGAGTGALCHDILNYLKNNEELYAQLRYCIIEKSPWMRQIEASHLAEKVSWHSSIQELAPFSGCVLSNELIDNLAVHQIVMDSELMEVFVDYQEGFTEKLIPASTALKDYLTEMNVVLPLNFRTEINLEALDWQQEIASSMSKGYVLTIDYGFTSDELYQDYRRTGTIVCYHKHQVNENPYQNIGEQDITTHINFSALIHYGAKHGLELCGYTNQGRFLLALGFKEYLKSIAVPGQDEANFKQELFLTQTLLMDMGRKFKVLIQGKGIPTKELLGLKLS